MKIEKHEEAIQSFSQIQQQTFSSIVGLALAQFKGNTFLSNALKFNLVIYFFNQPKNTKNPTVATRKLSNGWPPQTKRKPKCLLQCQPWSTHFKEPKELKFCCFNASVCQILRWKDYFPLVLSVCFTMISNFVI